LNLSPLPPAVVAFITRSLRSLEHLQLLEAVVGAADTWWDADSVARHLSIRPGAARTVLDDLARSNLLDIRITDDVRYRYRPTAPELDDIVKACLAAYRADPLRVVRAVTAARRDITRFADAFRIRRDADR
jgi:hypothetical protein